MASITRKVLTYFEQANEAVSLARLAQDLNMTERIVEGIINYWVRKGELREIVADDTTCSTCGIKTKCPFVTTLPSYYERAGTGTSSSACDCGGQCQI